MKTTCIKKGKIREVYDVGNDNIVIINTDRITTLNYLQPIKVPNKGVILNQINKLWLDKTKKIAPNYMISTETEDLPEEFQKEEYYGRAMLCKKLRMLPVEAFVRGYCAGTLWEHYKRTGKIGDMVFEDIREGQKLPLPLYEPRIEIKEGYKVLASFEDTISTLQKELGEKGKDYAYEIRSKSVKLYNFCEKYAEEHGVIIADASLKFGIDTNGELVLAGEIFTPETSRYWSADQYEVGKPQPNYTKQYLYNWLEENNFTTRPATVIPDEVGMITARYYKKAFIRITGKSIY